MEITFVKDYKLTYAIAKDQEYKGWMYEELIFAEIEQSVGKHIVRWQDNWSKLEVFDEWEDAKAHIIANHDIHAPYNNGKKWLPEIKEEGAN